MSPEEIKDILVGELPLYPSEELVFLAKSIRIDISRICYGCIKVFSCAIPKIEDTERKMWGRDNDPSIKAYEVCPDLELDPGQDKKTP